MTLIIGVRSKEGLVLAADSRGTIGDPRGLTAINDNHMKLFKLGKYCGIGLSGSSELGFKVVDNLKMKLKADQHDYADEILNLVRDEFRLCYHGWFEKFPVNERPAIAVILVGFMKNGDGDLVPQTYLLPSQWDFAPHLFPTGNCMAGVPQYATYLLHRFYDPEMTLKNLVHLAAYLITETASQDPKVGGPICVATVTPDIGFTELPTEGVKDIVKANNEQNLKLKQFFGG